MSDGTGNNEVEASPSRLPEPDRNGGDSGNSGNSAAHLPEPSVQSSGGSTLPPPFPNVERDAPPHAPQPPGKSFGDATATDRRSRIAWFTANPNVKELPPDFEARDGDWQTIRDDDPFTRLYLDPEQPELITAERTKLQYDLLNAFWMTKMRLLNQGAGRESIVSKYGGKEQSERAIRDYPRRLREAWETLKDTPRIQAALRRRDNERRENALETIRQSMDDMIADNAFVIAESRRLFTKGAEAGLRDNEIADFVAATLREGSFAPAGTQQGETLAERLRSCDWYRPGYAPSVGAGVMPIKIGQQRAHSVRELIDACDAEPDEAQDYLFVGDIAAWLAGTLGETGLARSARDSVKYNSQRRNALELFVRSLCRDQGLPAEPDLMLPATLDFGVVPIGADRKLELNLQSANSRRSWGTCTLIPTLPGVTVTSSFSITSGVIELSLTTSDAQPGVYGTDLLIQVDVGKARTIPVRLQIATATLRVVPDSIDFGILDFNRMYEATLIVDTVEGDATLTASYASDGLGEALTATGDELGKQCTANVKLATGHLRAGTSGQGLVRIVTNVGAADVPIRYSVSLNRMHAIRWAAGAAMAGAIGLGLVRRIIAGSNSELTGWIHRITISGPTFVTGFGLGLCILLVWVAVAKLAKRKRK